MPGSLTGLLITVAVLTPGYVHYAIRRRLVPIRRLSVTMEGAGLFVVAAVANTLMFAIFGIVGSIPPLRGHTPDIADLMSDPSGYALLDNSRLAYVTVWVGILIFGASGISAAFAYRFGPLDHLSRRFAPVIARVSGWYQVFRIDPPEDSIIHVGCELQDGSYAAGRLVWFTTEPEDSPDRELILAPPFTAMNAEGGTLEFLEEGRVILSVREIRRMDVTYLNS